MAWKLHAIDQMQLRKQHRGNGVGRPKFDFHTGYGEPGATTIIQRSYDDVVHTPRRLSIDGDDPLEGDDGVASRAANQNFTAPHTQSDTHRSGASTSNWTRQSPRSGCRR